MPDAVPKPFGLAHATHPDWRMALSLCLAHLEASAQTTATGQATLGFLYLSDHYAEAASTILSTLRERTGVTHWVGAVGVGVAATGAEYIDEPAMAMMLTDTPAEQFQVFSGRQRLPEAERAWQAIVHADPSTPELPALISELRERLGSGQCTGGLASNRQGASMIADELLEGGLSGVVYTRDVHLLTGLTQGCHPISPVLQITARDGQMIRELDGRPALDVLLETLGVDPGQLTAQAVRDGRLKGDATEAREIIHKLRSTLLGLGTRETLRRGRYQVRPLLGLDPVNRGLALSLEPEQAEHLFFCRRDAQASRLDLRRLCTSLREELEAEDGSLRQIRGAVYISCLGRTGALLGGPSAELQLIRHELGEIPLVGLFASGEMLDGELYGYTGVLTLFT